MRTAGLYSMVFRHYTARTAHFVGQKLTLWYNMFAGTAGMARNNQLAM